MTSCKSFSGRASELVSDLQVIIDPTVTKSSSTTAHPATTVDEEECSEDQVDGKDREGDFFDQAEVSDDQVDYDSWESGSIHSGGKVPSRLRPLDDDEYTPDSDSDSDTPLPLSHL